jgi:hypothetical protein
MGHPALCTDTSSLAMLAHDKLVLFANGGKFPLPSKSPFSQVSEVALSAQLLLGLLVLPQDLSQVDTRTLVSPTAMFLVVLRQGFSRQLDHGADLPLQVFLPLLHPPS